MTAWLALVPPCPLRALAGFPCPTCGTTRAVAALLCGDVLGALALNPGVLLGGLAFAVVVGRGLWVEWGTGRFPAPAPRDAAARRRAALVTGLVVAANWAWVLWHDAVPHP